MAANTEPIFPKSAKVLWAKLPTVANTATDGTGTIGTDIVIVGAAASTASGGEGERLDFLRLQSLGTNSNATLCRLFINNGSANSTATNNTLIAEIELPATTLSQTAARGYIDVSLDGICLMKDYKLLATLGTAPTSAGWQATLFSGPWGA